jgi:hypothetical protein
MLSSLAALGLILTSPFVRAQGGPPMITDDPGTVDKGHWEINLALVQREESHAHDSELPLIDINYGASERVQLKLEGGWNRSEALSAGSHYGFGGISLGVKARFIDDFHGWRVSTYPQVEYAPGDGSHVIDVLVPLQFQRDVGDYGVNFDVGREVRELETDAWTAGCAVGRKVGESLEWAAEVRGEGSARTSTLAANVGVRITRWKSGVPLVSIGRELRNAPGEHPAWLGYFGWQISR